jgi:hypothetical protein
MILTRPDIAFILERLLQFIKTLVERYSYILKWLLQYIHLTIKQKLYLGLEGAYSNSIGVYINID